jgi:hypothetical protein
MASAKIGGRYYENMNISATGESILDWFKNVLILKINLNGFNAVMSVSGV